MFCERPTTSGTSICLGSTATVRRTVEPRGARLRGAGSWASTVPGSASSSSFGVTVTLKSSSALRASSWVLPTTSGTGRRSGPLETSIFTALPDSDSEPPSGDCEMTRLIGTLSENERVSSISKPASVSVLRACNRPSPTTSGTLSIAGPSETRIVIVAPSSTVVPPPGSWPKTVLRGLSDVSRTVSTSKPSLVRRCWATEIDAPTTLGTATFFGVSVDTSSTMSPSRSRPPSTNHGQRLRSRDGGTGSTATGSRRCS